MTLLLYSYFADEVDYFRLKLLNSSTYIRL